MRGFTKIWVDIGIHPKLNFKKTFEVYTYYLLHYFSIFSPLLNSIMLFTITNALPESKSFSEIRLDTAAETKLISIQLYIQVYTMYSGSPRQMNPFEILVCSLSGDETYSNPCIVGKTDIKLLRSLLTSFFFSFSPGFTWNA